MSRIALCLAASIFLSSCKDDDKDDNKTVASAKLGASSITAPANLPSLSEVQAKKALTDLLAQSSPASTNLLALIQGAEPVPEEGDTGEDPGTEEEVIVVDGSATEEPGEETDGESRCVDALMDNAVVKASGSTVTYDYTADLSACYAETITQSGATEIKISQATIAVYGELTCSGQNFDSVNGKKVSELETALPKDCPGTIGNLGSNSFTLKGTAKVGDQLITFDTSSVNASSQADGSACTATLSNGVRTQASCVEVSSLVDGSNPAANHYYKSVSTNLTWDENSTAKYYNSGSISYEINDWVAVVTFTGKDTPPTYKLTKGTQVIEGTLTY